MSEKTNRFKIARSFGSASTSYDISARLQRYCGKHLMPWLPNRNDLTAFRFGCGYWFFYRPFGKSLSTSYWCRYIEKNAKFF